MAQARSCAKDGCAADRAMKNVRAVLSGRLGLAADPLIAVIAKSQAAPTCNPGVSSD
jgi:hypothetical protein